AVGDALGSSVAAAGDVDGDGHADFLVSTYHPDPTTGGTQARLYSGLDGRLLRSWSGEVPLDSFGVPVSGGTDLDGGGVPDVLVGAPCHDAPGLPCAGRVYAFSGRTFELLWTRDGEGSYVYLPDWRALAGIGDSDGDGVGDVVAGNSNFDAPSGYNSGRTYV